MATNNGTLCTQMGISAKCRMEFSKSDDFEVTGPSELCYHSVMSLTQEADKWTAITGRGVDQLEYTRLEIWFW